VLLKYYTGIGARKTNQKVLNYMQNLAEILAQKDYILRSGGAYGSDTAFEIGCDRVNGKKEIYLPWKEFENNKSSLYDLPNKYEASIIAKKHHPSWDILSNAVKSMHTRNTYQVLGQDLNTPSLFVICWTDGTGGTMQALRIAKTLNIPIFNLKLEKKLDTIDPQFFVEHIEQTLADRVTSNVNMSDLERLVCG